MSSSLPQVSHARDATFTTARYTAKSPAFSMRETFFTSTLANIFEVVRQR